MEFKRARLERAAVAFNRHFPASQSRILPKIDKSPRGAFWSNGYKSPKKMFGRMSKTRVAKRLGGVEQLKPKEKVP